MKKIYFDSMGPSGNIYAILSMVRRAIGEEDYKEMSAAVYESGSYEEALSHIRKYVDLIDVNAD